MPEDHVIIFHDNDTYHIGQKQDREQLHRNGYDGRTIDNIPTVNEMMLGRTEVDVVEGGKNEKEKKQQEKRNSKNKKTEN